jgi:hypothetical protein
MSTTTSNGSKPICAAVLLDMETVEALQSHLADKNADYNDDNDNMSSCSSSSSTSIKITESKLSPSSKSAATTVNILNFLTGICTGAMLSCAGFAFLLQHWHSMNLRDILLFGLVWGVVTCVATYLLLNLLSYTGTRCCHFGNSNSNNSNSKYSESRKTAALLENCFGSGTFLGFSGVCNSTDVVQGMATSIIILTVVVASLWACLMVYCALAAPAEKLEPKAPASKKSSSKSPQKSVLRSPQKAAPKAVVPAAISVVQVTKSP